MNPEVIDLPTTEIGSSKKWSASRAVSPFRYPGGKGFLTGYLEQRLLDIHPSGERHFVEPFCGGAGAAVSLLKNGIADCLHLNDADLRIFSAWTAMLTESRRFVDKLMSAELNMEEWYSHRDIVSKTNYQEYNFELGFSAFYMNRTTRSGIIEKAGPIGGYSQNGKWKLNARFNKPGIAEKILWLADQQEQIQISNLDALTFINKCNKRINSDSSLFFIDPPYFKEGGRLYFNGMDHAKHVALSDILTSGSLKNWVLTYDNAPLIRSLYAEQNISKIIVNYSLQSKRKENEILVLPA